MWPKVWTCSIEFDWICRYISLITTHSSSSCGALDFKDKSHFCLHPFSLRNIFDANHMSWFMFQFTWHYWRALENIVSINYSKKTVTLFNQNFRIAKFTQQTDGCKILKIKYFNKRHCCRYLLWFFVHCLLSFTWMKNEIDSCITLMIDKSQLDLFLLGLSLVLPIGTLPLDFRLITHPFMRKQVRYTMTHTPTHSPCSCFFVVVCTSFYAHRIYSFIIISSGLSLLINFPRWITCSIVHATNTGMQVITYRLILSQSRRKWA